MNGKEHEDEGLGAFGELGGPKVHEFEEGRVVIFVPVDLFFGLLRCRLQVHILIIKVKDE